MSDINSIGNNENKIFSYKPQQNKNKIQKNNRSNKNGNKVDKVEIKGFDEGNDKSNKINENYNQPDPIKRPIKIDDNNNTFFINYKGENKSIKIKPGNYTLTEISISIKEKINESFGMGKVKLKMAGTISDGLIHAEENETNKFLIEE